MNRVETARTFAHAFESKTRDNGESFTFLRDGSPEWMRDAVHAAHDDMLPNDMSYSLIRDMAFRIVEALSDDADADLMEIIEEASDSLIPIYTNDRLAWFASHLNRVGYVDDAINEFGLPKEGGIVQAIAYGIQAELHMIGSALVSAIEAEADDESEDD